MAAKSRRAGKARRRSRKQTTAGVSSAARLVPERSDEIVVRMYRQGLGDCFLLAIPDDGGVKYVLIDCGVHARQTDGPARLAQVLADLGASTGSHIDLVVATHEHADHLCGFVQKQSPFLDGTLQIDRLWLAWTEKRGDDQADRLRKKRGTAQRIIDKAVKEATRRDARVAGLGLAARLREVTDFERPPEGSVDERAVSKLLEAPTAMSPLIARADAAGMTRKKQKKRPSSNELALGLLAARAGDNRTAYCEAGEVRRVLDHPLLRAYVFGPPRSELLTKDRPSKIRGAREGDPGGVYKEVYLASGSRHRTLELSPALRGSTDEGTATDWQYPFASAFHRCCEVGVSKRGESRLKWVGSRATPRETKAFFAKTYQAPGAEWRRIDADWLGAAEELAVNLVGDTNNSSLVLALEWGPAGRGAVLLFPGDAQVGNWLSWRDQDYRIGDRRVSADDLLARTVLYKVGHHGSHNATARRDPREASPDDPVGVAFGLELMNDIVAMIPVDYDAAKKEMPDPWKMPHEPLYRRLREKARLRVLRSDSQLTPLDGRGDDPDIVPTKTRWEPVPGLPNARWRRSAEQFQDGTPGPLYYDVAITRPVS